MNTSPNRTPLSRRSVVSSPNRRSNSSRDFNYNDLIQHITGIIEKQDRRIAERKENAMDRRTVVHFNDESITLPDLYGLVLKNTEVLGLVVPLIDSIIHKLIECIKDETYGHTP